MGKHILLVFTTLFAMNAMAQKNRKFFKSHCCQIKLC